MERLAEGDADRGDDEEVAPLHPDQEEGAGDLAGKPHHRVDDGRHVLQKEELHHFINIIYFPLIRFLYDILASHPMHTASTLDPASLIALTA